MVYIIMGVSGCGKTTIGKILADKLHLPFYDADDYHPSENVKKMKSGLSLNDSDRRPWLEILSSQIQKWNASGGAVLACSALKKSYREILLSGNSSNVLFIYLKGDKKLILKRMMKRKDHYMPPSLLDSQFKALEEPLNAIEVDISNIPETIVSEILAKIASV